MPFNARHPYPCRRAGLYRRFRYGKPIVVVSGLPRSGTSMAMKMLEAGGLRVVTDGLRTADEDNPRGYFEDERVKDLYREGDKTWLRESRGKAIKVISFLLKSLPSENNYKVLFMHRDFREIVASQNKMLVRRGERNETSDERAVELLEEQVRDARFFLRRPQFDVLELNYAEMLSERPPGGASDGSTSSGRASTSRRWSGSWTCSSTVTAPEGPPLEGAASLHVAQAAELLELLLAHALGRLAVGLEPRRRRHLVPRVERLRQPRDHVGVRGGHVLLVERVLVEVEQLELGLARAAA